MHGRNPQRGRDGPVVSLVFPTYNPGPVLEKTWRAVLPVGDTAAELFYGKLFSLDPQVRRLFKYDMLEQGRNLTAMISVAAPCRLPNAFVADPPLDPVTARTYEFGLRGKVPLGDALAWSLAFFRTDLNNDILFITAEPGGAGFFQNVAKTRRQGIEAGVQGRWKRLGYFLNYAYVDSTYRSSETLASVRSVVSAAERFFGTLWRILKVPS